MDIMYYISNAYNLGRAARRPKVGNFTGSCAKQEWVAFLLYIQPIDIMKNLPRLTRGSMQQSLIGADLYCRQQGLDMHPAPTVPEISVRLVSLFGWLICPACVSFGARGVVAW
jgi:hypothetical protein